MPNALYADFWERQTSITSNKEFIAFSNNKNNTDTNNQTHKTQSGGGMYFAAPAATTHRELHGPVYVQEDNRRVGMTFQQEERRREELRKQEEAKQEEKRKLELEMEAQRLQEEQQRKLEEMRQAQEEEMRRQEEARRLEMERQQMLALQRQEEERKRQAEIEEKKRQEELRRAEEEKLKQQELKRIEEEKKRQEILRFEKLKQEEELKGQEEYREEDGYFTCAVSVQHKKHDFETSSAYSASDSEHARKVVWPANQAKGEKQVVDTSRTFQNTFSKSTSQADQPHKWLHMSEHDDTEKKAPFEMRQQVAHRISRSSSRSKNIMERARSFERAAAESRGNSRPASRTGSIASRHRSPSGNRGQVEEMWMNQLERPSSRTDVDSRRFGEIGRVQTAEWEGRIKGSTENLPTRTPPPKRKELNMKRNPDLERGFDTKTPEPPPPPTRMTYPPNTIKEPECEFPPPPESDTKSKLSEESVGQISEENKENIVKQWVESTTQSAEEIAKELEKFAYDIAETVVSNMEKNSEKKESFGSHSHQSLTTSSALDQTHKTQSGGGMYFAAPASTTHRELHGPVYVQEDNRRVGMTFQQEERRREELRKQEEAKQEEKRKLELEME